MRWGNGSLLIRISVVILTFSTLPVFGTLSCNNAVKSQVEIVGRWDYSNPPGIEDIPELYYHPGSGFREAITVTTAEIVDKDYMIMSFDPLSGPGNCSLLSIYDIEDPFSPELVSIVTRPSEGRTSYLVRGAAVYQNIFYATLFHGRGIWVVDISDPANPIDLGIAPIEVTANIIVADDYAYAYGQMYDGVTIMDISDTQEIREIARVPLSSRSFLLKVFGDYLYVAIKQTLTIYDVSDPASPEMLCSYDLRVPEGLVRNMPPSGPKSEMEEFPWANLAQIVDMLSYGDYLYVTFGAGQLRVIDVSDPRDPEEVAEVELEGFVIRMTQEGENLYVTKSDNEDSTLQMCLLDISRPEIPELLDSLDTGSIFGFGGSTMGYMWIPPMVFDEYVYIKGYGYMDVVSVK